MSGRDRPQEKMLLSLFLSRYECEAWSEPNADHDWRDEREDGAVEVVATRYADGKQLAIEHTLIEPFVGDNTDFHQFKLLLVIEQDESLNVLGRYVYVDVPVGFVTKGHEQANIEELRGWIKANAAHLPLGRSEHVGRFSGHKAATPLKVRVSPAEHGDGDVLIRRYGDKALATTVRKAILKALTAKIPKLVKTTADCRVLMLEHRPFSVDERTIEEAVEVLTDTVPGIESVDEIWCVETVSNEGSFRFTHRSRTAGGSELMFIGGELHLDVRKGIWRPAFSHGF